ncbi:MAG TPA: hypothetical protein VGN76_11375 [Gemmatimonadales bacterium]|jgi:hypothetical protein|nr:hypothetical protein [Gemmatimonadales bacterium]
MRTNRSSSQRVFYLFVGLLPLLIVLAVGALQNPGLNAQEVQLRPLGTIYLPSRISLQHGSLDARQKLGVTFGARLTLRFTKRFDVVTAITTSPGTPRFAQPANRSTSEPAPICSPPRLVRDTGSCGPRACSRGRFTPVLV